LPYEDKAGVSYEQSYSSTNGREKKEKKIKTNLCKPILEMAGGQQNFASSIDD